MARGSISVRGADGQLGYTGPRGAADWAAVGVASRATAIATQRPVVVTNVGDIETLVGIGPVRDLLAIALAAAGATVVVMPLQRASGGDRIGTGTITSGKISVTAIGGYALGRQDVTLECVTGGAAGTAEFRLVVDGVPQERFKPEAGDFGSAYAVPRASLGTLGTGVPDASTLRLTITTNAAFVAGENITWRHSEPQAAGAVMDQAVAKLSAHRVEQEFIMCAGCTSPATWGLLDTAVRMLPAQGLYNFVGVQAVGPDARTGGDSANTAEWVSALVSGLKDEPPRRPGPRLMVSASWMRMRDPITGYRKVFPALYAMAGAIAARQPWEPPDAKLYGPLNGDPEIYPFDMIGSQIDSLDDQWYATLTTYPGDPGTYITHARMWGEPPSAGQSGSDFVGVERRRVMDLTCRRVRRRLDPRVNGIVATGPGGRIAASEINQWEGEINSELLALQTIGAISDFIASVTDEDPGVLQTDTVVADIGIQPNAKAEMIRATIGFRVIGGGAAAPAGEGA